MSQSSTSWWIDNYIGVGSVSYPTHWFYAWEGAMARTDGYRGGIQTGTVATGEKRIEHEEDLINRRPRRVFGLHHVP